MKQNPLKIILILAFTVITLSSTACSKDDKSKQSTSSATAQVTATDSETGVYTISNIKSTGEKEPLDFSWTENGKSQTLSNFLKGKITFINFWGTWCPPCRAEIPALIELNKKYQDQGFQIIGIPLERDENTQMENVANFAKRIGINYRNFPSRPYADAFGQKFGPIQYVPSTFVVGRDGKVLETVVGGRDINAFEQIILKYIKN